jgi:hypothetical protein
MLKTRYLIAAFLAVVACLVARPAIGQISDLPLGQSVTGTMTSSADVHYYRVVPAMAAGQHVVVTLDKSEEWYCYLYLRPGGLSNPPVSSESDDEDLAVEVLSTQAAYYWVEVGGSSGPYPRTYTVTALTAEMLPTLTLGVGQAGALEGPQDRKFYRVTGVGADQHLMGFLDKTAESYCYLFLHPGGIRQAYVSYENDDEDLAVETLSTQAGDYYLEIRYGGTQSYTVMAATPQMLPTLTLGVGQAGALEGPQDRKFYRVAGVGADQHLMGFLDKTAEWYCYLFLRRGGVLQPAVAYNYGTTDLAVDTFPTGVGDYYLEIRYDGSNSYSILAMTDETTVAVASVSPAEPGNAGPVTLTVRGSGFQSGATVRACRHDEPATCVDATDVAVINPTEMAARFDFGGAPIDSVWDLWVTNPDLTQGGLLNALRLAQPQVNLWVDIVGPDFARPGRQVTYEVRAGNLGTVDAICPVLWISFPRGCTCRVNASLVGPPDIPGADPVDWSQVPFAIDAEDTTYIGLIIPGIPPGRILTVPVDIVPPAGQASLAVRAWISPPPLNPQVGGPTPGPAYTGSTLLATAGFTDQLQCYTAILEVVLDKLLLAGMIRSLPGGECWNELRGWTQERLKRISAYPQTYPLVRGPIAVPLTQELGQMVFILLRCAAIDASGVKWLFLIKDAGEGIGAIWRTYESCKKVLQEAWKDVVIRWPVDPNEKEASSGFGGEGRVGEWTGACPPDSLVDNGYVSPTRPLEYVIRFENLETATAEAENIVVTDTLDPSVDWTTLEIGETRIGGQTYYPAVTMNPATRTICWTFTGVNLPPNCDDPARPECKGIGKGEGSVSFSVQPLAGLQTGIPIHNYATIVFDTNPAMCTNDVMHTIDSVAPESQVGGLPEDSQSPFEVCWGGADDAGGTGVHDYTVYFSDNGEPFSAWLTNTMETSALFEGTAGHTYSFSSTAHDNVGNLERAHGTADAQTHVGAARPMPPSNLAASPLSSTQVDLNWIDNSSTEAGFKIERKLAADAMWSQMATVGANIIAYTDATCAPCTTYTYRVRAYNASGDSDYSNEAGATTTSTFGDVLCANWALPFIEGLYSAGITTGCAADSPGTPQNEARFCPADAVTRAQMAKFLVKAKGESVYNNPTPTFTDVLPTGTWAWAYGYVERIALLGITSGCTTTTYCPGNAVTRGQMAKFLVLAFGIHY